MENEMDINNGGVSVSREKPCEHPYLKRGENAGDKVCASCGRTIYSVKKETSQEHSKIKKI